MTERIEGPTPSGGAYAIVTFFDKEWNVTDKDHAEHCHITEYNERGAVIMETIST